ncbi:MAG: hypothetical protein ACSLEX_01100 [Minisyncoccota bacterium]
MVVSRTMKRSVIILTYGIFFSLLIGSVYFFFFKPTETCFDAIKNQNEQGIDCGGVCQAICRETLIGTEMQVTELAFVPAGEGQYDVLSQVYNPNDELGASSFMYTLALKDASGAVVGTRSGTSYILPQEKKYILEINMSTSGTPVSASLQVTEVEWTRFSGYQEKPVLNIYQKRYGPIASGSGFGEAYGLLSNESVYDFRSIRVKVILRESTGKPLAFNTTEMRTVNAHEQRDFRLVWPTAFPGTVEKVEMEVDADVYHSDNFVRQYLPTGKYQELSPLKAY